MNALASWFIQTLTGAADTSMDWRCIHDQRKDLPAHNYRGTLTEMLPTLEWYNSEGYGIFCNINALDGAGRNLENVQHIRAHVIDMDSVTAAADCDRATAAGASFVVQTSPGKFHVYFRVQPYTGNEFYTLQQRKFAQLYNGDKKVIDPTRIIRMPGFIHRKGEPQLVTAWPLPAFARLWTAGEIGEHLAHVNIVEYLPTRSPLGEPSMSAPSLEWLRFAMSLIDPNDLDRAEWLSLSAAIKQAGWLHSAPDALYNIWSEWCGRYAHNDAGENLKLWDSVRDTETGWTTIERRSTVKAYMMFGFKDAPPPKTAPPPAAAVPAGSTAGAYTGAEILSEYECREWFKGCYFIERMGEIFIPSGRYMDSTQFNGRYGGKNFIITSTGKITDEPWKAALRSTCWQVPKVDHVRFLPDRPTGEIITDGLGRSGLNTYIPARIDAQAGDVSRWLDWWNKILPNPNDQRIWFEYLAHCVKYPGYKIPWAPMLQSAEGIGKTILKEVMSYALGDMYCYSPKAPELVKSGSTFNAWMRGKLLIVVDEIKIDERRELIEILKPMITDARVEVQGKGVDQEMEDNLANWIFFSNHTDAIPITKSGRRYSISYSVLQYAVDITAAGMDDDYFLNIWQWLREGGGLQSVAYWLLNYPIQRGKLPVRAPETSSHAEALRISRSPMEVTIADCIADAVPGFRGGYISALAVVARCKLAGIRTPNAHSVKTCLQAMGYTAIGRAVRCHMQEDVNNRAELYAVRGDMPAAGYGAAQGYE